MGYFEEITRVEVNKGTQEAFVFYRSGAVHVVSAQGAAVFCPPPQAPMQPTGLSEKEQRRLPVTGGLTRWRFVFMRGTAPRVNTIDPTE